jgi:hypothetical protein
VLRGVYAHLTAPTPSQPAKTQAPALLALMPAPGLAGAPPHEADARCAAARRRATAGAAALTAGAQARSDEALRRWRRGPLR